MRHDIVETVCDTEEVRTVDLVHLYARRDRQVLQVGLYIGVFVRVDLVVEGADLRLLARTHQEEYQRQQDTYLDSYRQVEDKRQEEGDQQ